MTLKKATILITRPKHQAEKLRDLVLKNNGIPVCFPTIEITPISLKPNEIERNLENVDVFIFTSANAVHLYCSQFDVVKIQELKTKMCLVIGQATADALLTYGLSVDLIPQHGYNSESLLKLSELQTVSDKKIVIIRGENGREVLGETLKKRGAIVSYCDVYRRDIPTSDCLTVLRLLEENKLDFITITSGEALQNLIKMLPETQHNLLRKIPLIVVSERIQILAKNLGFETIALAQMPSDDAILKTITTIINGE